MNHYLEKLNVLSHPKKHLDLEAYAKEYNIPIIQYESLVVLLSIIKLKKINKILEIGTAIAYSALEMAELSKDIRIDTIERDEAMYALSIKNIQKYQMDKNIQIHFGDALEFNLDELGKEYDLIFIDAAKSQYEKFFNRFSPLLHKEGVIVTDNILFHGCVEEVMQEHNNLTKNVRHMAKKIDLYNHFLSSNSEFETFYISVGDGLAVSMRKNHD